MKDWLQPLSQNLLGSLQEQLRRPRTLKYRMNQVGHTFGLSSRHKKALLYSYFIHTWCDMIDGKKKKNTKYVSADVHFLKKGKHVP